MSVIILETAAQLRRIRDLMSERPIDWSKWKDEDLNAALSLAFAVHHHALPEGGPIDETNAAGALAIIYLVLREGEKRGWQQDPGDALWRWFRDVADAYVQQTSAS